MKPSGYARVAAFGSLQILVHWSFPLAGLLVAVLGALALRHTAVVVSGYACIVLVHELAHALVARACGLQVHSLEFSAMGGMCRFERADSVRRMALVVGAGVVVQFVIALVAIGWVAVNGLPESSVGIAVVGTATLLNLAIAAGSLLPHRIRGGTRSDGLLLWQLYRHAKCGDPHPFPPLHMAAAEQAPVFDRDHSMLQEPAAIPAGFVHGIQILNDRTTPMELVVSLLHEHLALSREEAIALMLDIHNRGGVLVALDSRAAADRAAVGIASGALEAGHALGCRAVSVTPR